MTEAERYIKAFCGVARTAKAAEVSRSTVYRWTYPEEQGGTGGVIPRKSKRKLDMAADILGITIPAE